MTARMIEQLWQRVGDIGLPPLGKRLWLGGKEIGRIVDVADYPDDPENTVAPVYQIEWKIGDDYVEDERRFTEFNQATCTAFDEAATGGRAA